MGAFDEHNTIRARPFGAAGGNWLPMDWQARSMGMGMEGVSNG